jgi:hypothetical protein
MPDPHLSGKNQPPNSSKKPIEFLVKPLRKQHMAKKVKTIFPVQTPLKIKR